MVSLSHGVVSPYLRVGGEGEGALHRIEPLVLLERHLPFLEGAVLAYAGGQAVVGGWGVSQG